MAVTSTIEYCTDRDVQDIFPHIAEYDLKRRLYGFQQSSAGTNWYDSTLDIWFLHNTGLITELFFDGSKCYNIH